MTSRYNSLTLPARRSGGSGTAAEPTDADEQLQPDSIQKVKTIIIDEVGFWRPLVSCLRVCLPIVKLLRLLDGNKPIIGKIYMQMFLVSEKLQNARGLPCIARIRAIHASRWEYLHSEMHAAAYALDPEFMDTVGSIDSATQAGLHAVMEKMALRDAILASDDVDKAANELNTRSPEVYNRVAQLEMEFAKFQSKDGAFNRESVKINAKRMAPATWWRTYGRHLPLLCNLACTVLAQVGSASACERNWSVYGRIRKDRSRLGHSRSDKLVYAHEAMNLHEKLMDASYEEEVEAWDYAGSDSACSSDADFADFDADLTEAEFQELAR